MSETRDPAAAPNSSNPYLDYNSGGLLSPGSSGLLRLGGALGIAACSVGLLIFVAGCAGFGKAMVLSVVPLALSVAGLVLSLAGSWTQKHLISEDTHVLQALFANASGLIGGLLLFAVWRGWHIFYV